MAFMLRSMRTMSTALTLLSPSPSPPAAAASRSEMGPALKGSEAPRSDRGAAALNRSNLHRAALNAPAEGGVRQVRPVEDGVAQVPLLEQLQPTCAGGVSIIIVLVL